MRHKKLYIKPTVKTIKLHAGGIICTSPLDIHDEEAPFVGSNKFEYNIFEYNIFEEEYEEE